MHSISRHTHMFSYLGEFKNKKETFSKSVKWEIVHKDNNKYKLLARTCVSQIFFFLSKTLVFFTPIIQTEMPIKHRVSLILSEKIYTQSVWCLNIRKREWNGFQNVFSFLLQEKKKNIWDRTFNCKFQSNSILYENSFKILVQTKHITLN